MRIKYIKTADLAEMEATVNLLLMQGWDRDGILQKEESGEYLLAMVNYERVNRDVGGYSEPRINRPPVNYQFTPTEGAEEILVR